MRPMAYCKDSDIVAAKFGDYQKTCRRVAVLVPQPLFANVAALSPMPKYYSVLQATASNALLIDSFQKSGHL
jgi:hypothetical protein